MLHKLVMEKVRQLRPECPVILFALLLVIFGGFAAESFGQDLARLSATIQNGSAEQKRDALFQIRNLRTEASARIAVSALSDPEAIVRATAASSVTSLPKAECAALLLPLLNDKIEIVRIETAYALGKVGSTSPVPPLIRMLKDDRSNSVRSAAAVALGEIGDATAVDALAAILKQKPKTDDEFLRRAAARSTGQIAQIIRTGNRRVDTPQNFLPEKYKDKKPDAEPATNAFPAFRVAMPILLSVLSNKKESDDVRREAAFALGAIGDVSARPILSNYLNAPDNYLAEICKEALLKLDRPH